MQKNPELILLPSWTTCVTDVSQGHGDSTRHYQDT